jgi:hypothetical protein
VAARESFNRAVLNYNNSITEARLQNNAVLAEIAAEALKEQLQLALQGFQYKNTLVQEKANKKMQIDSEYHSRYQDVLKQINTENAMAEEVRQFNEKMAFEREQYEYAKAQAAKSSSGGGSSSKKSSGSSSKSGSGSSASINKSGSGGSSSGTMKSIIDLGYGPISANYLASKVASGEVVEYDDNGTTKFKNATKKYASATSAMTDNLKYKSATAKSTGTFGAASILANNKKNSIN